MLEGAHALFLDRKGWLEKQERVEILERAAVLFEEDRERLALLATQEGGKPLADSRVEVRRASEGIKSAVAELRTRGGREIPMGLSPGSLGRVAYTYFEPRGVVAAVSAFNHPVNLIIHQVIPAFAAGCPVIVKPSSRTPLCCQAVLELLFRAGVPPAWIQMLVATPAVAEALVTDERVAFFSFIGSAEVGWRLRSKVARGTAVAMEHGGVAPAIVDETADLEAATSALVKGAFTHAGQVCVSVQRIFVEQSVFSEFAARFVAKTEALRTGDPILPDTDVGPLISGEELLRVEQWVGEALASGGKLHCGGKRLSDSVYAPTVISEPSPDCRLSTTEIFGPVVALYPYDEIGDAVRRANQVDAYFQASVFTENLRRGMDLSRELHGKAVMINESPAFRVDWMPFGGHKNSGLGVGGIPASMQEMSLERLFVLGR